MRAADGLVVRRLGTGEGVVLPWPAADIVRQCPRVRERVGADRRRVGGAPSARARAAGESLSDRLRRYAEEGARRDEHPLITFRDGPTGRRAGLVGGPDVWEVAMWLDDLAGESDPDTALAEDGIVTRPQIDAALRYRAAYPDEIDARIELHRRETAAADTR
jgi:hypothetical protein